MTLYRLAPPFPHLLPFAWARAASSLAWVGQQQPPASSSAGGSLFSRGWTVQSFFSLFSLLNTQVNNTPLSSLKRREELFSEQLTELFTSRHVNYPRFRGPREPNQQGVQ